MWVPSPPTPHPSPPAICCSHVCLCAPLQTQPSCSSQSDILFHHVSERQQHRSQSSCFSRCCQIHCHRAALTAYKQQSLMYRALASSHFSVMWVRAKQEEQGDNCHRAAGSSVSRPSNMAAVVSTVRRVFKADDGSVSSSLWIHSSAVFPHVAHHRGN